MEIKVILRQIGKHGGVKYNGVAFSERQRMGCHLHADVLHTVLHHPCKHFKP